MDLQGIDLQGTKRNLIIGYDTAKVFQLTLQLICCAVALIRSSQDQVYFCIFIPNGMLLLLNSILFGKQCLNPIRSKETEAFILTTYLVAFVPMVVGTSSYYAFDDFKPTNETEHLSKDNETFYESSSLESDHNNTDPLSVTTTDWFAIKEFFDPSGPFTGYQLDKVVGYPGIYGISFTGFLTIIEIIIFYITRKLHKVQLEIDREIASDNPITGCEWVQPRPRPTPSDISRQVEEPSVLEELEEEEERVKKTKSSQKLSWKKFGQH
ncbi:UNVERIFIED_CONTAM: hypothetical protein RMT77_002911 [Armadillidium vulgare]